MSKEEPRPSRLCTSAKCYRVPYQDGECWLCPDCKKKLEDRMEHLEQRAMNLELDRDMWKRQATKLLQKPMSEEAAKALELAAKALDIADDCNLVDVQINPPKEWGLVAYSGDAADGWCSTRQLARKLREIVRALREKVLC